MATWSIDTGHSAIHVGVRHMMFTKTRGRFTRWSGELRLDPADLPSSSVEVTIDAASIDTGDAHLKSADFLEVEKFPALTFRSTRVEDLGEGKLRVSGELTIRGVTRPVELDTEYAGRVKDPWGNDRAGFTARTVIDGPTSACAGTCPSRRAAGRRQQGRDRAGGRGGRRGREGRLRSARPSAGRAARSFPSRGRRPTPSGTRRRPLPACNTP